MKTDKMTQNNPMEVNPNECSARMITYGDNKTNFVGCPKYGQYQYTIL